MTKNLVLTLVLSGLATSVMAASSPDDNALAEKAAKELANPNTAYASLNLKLQYNDGYDQGGSNFTTVFQPTLPFPMEGGDKIIFRPAVSYIDNNFSDSRESGVSDISFDLAYAPKTEPGTIAAVGMIASLPTGTDGLSSEQFAVGPEFLVGSVTPERVLGAFPNHLVGVSGSGIDEARINKTSAQLFWVEMLGGGWTVGSAPTLSYDWTNDQAEIPINVSVTKTVVMGGRPWKFGLEANYYLEKDEKTRPDFMLGFNITPVVENKLMGLFN